MGSSLAIESLQTLVAPAEAMDEGVSQVLRRLFDEKPKLRGGLMPHQVEDIIEEYGDDEGSSGSAKLQTTMLLFAICVTIKCFCLFWCSYVATHASSDISKTLAL